MLPVIERRREGNSAHISADLAFHLQTRSVVGRSAILVEHPVVFRAVLGKRWRRLCRRLQVERASTLDPLKMLILGSEIARTQVLRFSRSAFESEADVLVLAPEDVGDIPPGIATLYVCCEVPKEAVAKVMETMALGGVVVLYGRFSTRRVSPKSG